MTAYRCCIQAIQRLTLSEPSFQTVMYDKYTPIAQTAPRLWQPPQMSFRGAKRRGNPLNRNVNTVAIAIDLACSRNLYRAENLCYQFKQGQKLLPQFRKIVCLVNCAFGASGETKHLFKAYLLTEYAYSKCEPQGGEIANAELDV